MHTDVHLQTGMLILLRTPLHGKIDKWVYTTIFLKQEKWSTALTNFIKEVVPWSETSNDYALFIHQAQQTNAQGQN